jgi:hypothetical protein
MITQGLWQTILEKQETKATGRLGLSWIAESMEHFGLKDIINKQIKKSTHRAISGWEKVLAGALTLIAGGNRIEDIEQIRADKGLLHSLKLKSLPSPDTYLDFLGIKRSGGKLRKINEETIIKALKKTPISEFTYDNDATYFDSNKDSAAYSYQKEKQFSALLGTIPELSNLCATVDFRPGNVSPAAGILNQLKKAVLYAKKTGKKLARFRSDSAAHNLDIFLYCESNNIKYFVSLDKNAITKKEAKGIREENWQALPDRKDVEWAETIHVMARGKKCKLAMRTLILRWPNPEPNLFAQEPYYYHIIATNDWDILPMDWLKFHNGRMASENVNKELKTGLAACYMPSHNFDKNRAHFLVAVLAYNFLQIFKLFYLGKNSLTWTVKTLRYRFIFNVAVFIRHARSTTCRLLNVTKDTFYLFKKCQAAWMFI